MSYHNATAQFTSTGASVVTIIPNTGTAKIQIKVGSDYKDIAEYAENSSVTVEGRGLEYQVVVTGDAEYEVN